jgi:hypothetical protein
LASLELYVPQLTTRVENLVAEIASCSQKQSIQEISKWFARFSFDFAGDLAFGGGFELTKNGDTEGYIQLIQAAQRAIPILGQIPEICSFPNSLADHTIDLTSSSASIGCLTRP